MPFAWWLSTLYNFDQIGMTKERLGTPSALGALWRAGSMGKVRAYDLCNEIHEIRAFRYTRAAFRYTRAVGGPTWGNRRSHVGLAPLFP